MSENYAAGNETVTYHPQVGPSFTGFLQGEVGWFQLLGTDEDDVVSRLQTLL